MITASVKKRENIAEYLLYMWQIEDIIRAYGLDSDRIQSEIIDRYSGLSDTQKKEMREWYESLIDMMRREDAEKSGHIPSTTFIGDSWQARNTRPTTRNSTRHCLI